MSKAVIMSMAFLLIATVATARVSYAPPPNAENIAPAPAPDNLIAILTSQTPGWLGGGSGGGFGSCANLISAIPGCFLDTAGSLTNMRPQLSPKCCQVLNDCLGDLPMFHLLGTGCSGHA